MYIRAGISVSSIENGFVDRRNFACGLASSRAKGFIMERICIEAGPSSKAHRYDGYDQLQSGP
jgi:hypothetical protein